jgi:hypothetical protein
MIHIRRMRQLIPTKFATAYRTREDSGHEWKPVFTTWWMWLGRCFRVNHTAI